MNFIDNQNLIRAINWIYDIFSSGLGIATLVAALGLILPERHDLVLFELLTQNTLTTEQKKTLNGLKATDERIKKRRKRFSIFLICLIIAFGLIKYFGMVNVEEVFGNEYEYKGQTLNNKAEGLGVKKTTDGNLIYSGSFRANLFEGDGRLYDIVEVNTKGDHISILQYDGEFKQGSYNGYGKLYDTSFPYMLTNIKQDLIDENGIDIRESSGNIKHYEPFLRYEGNFSNSKFEGQGTYYDNPDMNNNIIKYTGHFKNGKLNGYGEKYQNDELLESGYYSDWKLISPYKQ